MKCAECAGMLQLEALPALAGRSGNVELEVHGAKALGCGQPGHPRQPVQPGYATDLLAALWLEGGFATAIESGWLRKRRRCSACGAGVGEAQPEPGELRCRVRVQLTSPCSVGYRGPVVGCPGCGTALLPASPELEASLHRALSEAFGSAGVADA